LIPRYAEFTPVDVEECVICDVAILDAITKLNDGQRYGGGGKCKGQQILILEKRFFGNDICVFNERFHLGWRRLRDLAAFGRLGNVLGQLSRCRKCCVRSVVELNRERMRKVF